MRISFIMRHYIIMLLEAQLFLQRCERVSDRRSRLDHEVHVSFGARHYHVHPDAHGLRRRRHHVVDSIVGLHAEGQRRVGALRTFQGGGGGERREAADEMGTQQCRLKKSMIKRCARHPGCTQEDYGHKKKREIFFISFELKFL